MKNLITVAGISTMPNTGALYPHKGFEPHMYNLPALDKSPWSATRQALYRGTGTRQMPLTKRVPHLHEFLQDPGTPGKKYDHKWKTLRKNVHQNIPA